MDAPTQGINRLPLEAMSCLQATKQNAVRTDTRAQLGHGHHFALPQQVLGVLSRALRLASICHDGEREGGRLSLVTAVITIGPIDLSRLPLVSGGPAVRLV